MITRTLIHSHLRGGHAVRKVARANRFSAHSNHNSVGSMSAPEAAPSADAVATKSAAGQEAEVVAGDAVSGPSQLDEGRTKCAYYWATNKSALVAAIDISYKQLIGID